MARQGTKSAAATRARAGGVRGGQQGAATAAPAVAGASTGGPRDRILEAARAVFEAVGLEGASMRAIGAAAGYTAAALYFHFPNKEAVYASLLDASLGRLTAAIAAAVDTERMAARRFVAGSLAFYDFYAARPRDLELGFYLFRGGMRRRGLSPELDQALNDRLLAALQPIDAEARALGGGRKAALDAAASIMAHAAGLLLLVHTGRLGLFGSDSRRLMAEHAEALAEALAALQPSQGAVDANPDEQIAARRAGRTDGPVTPATATRRKREVP